MCISHTLSGELLLHAYRHGIFPWTDDPIGWFAPPQRGILLVQEAHFPRNFPKLLRRAQFTVTFDTAFAAVMKHCRKAHEADGVWITKRFVRAYTELAAMGHAHSVEIWQDGTLVGGTYGVQTGCLFAAESMFGLVDHASRAAVFALVQFAAQLQIAAIDVQVLNDVTARLGAVAIPRETFSKMLQASLSQKGAHLPHLWPTQSFDLFTPLPTAAALSPTDPLCR